MYAHKLTCKMQMFCGVYVKMFALSLLSSAKEARSRLRHQRAALGTSTDTASVSAANQQAPSPASASQSEASRLFSLYRESRLQVFLCNFFPKKLTSMIYAENLTVIAATYLHSNGHDLHA